jgi:hypothetical protein
MKLEAHKVIQVTDIEKAKDLVVAALKADSCKVAVTSENGLVAKRGSQAKLRIVGGMFIGLKDLPVKLSVDFSSNGEISQVDLSAVDDMGLGSKILMSEKYQNAVVDILEVAASHLSAIEVQQGKSATSNDGRFCTQCGARSSIGDRFCSGCGTGI